MSRTATLTPQSERELILICDAIHGALHSQVKSYRQGDSPVSVDGFDCYFIWHNGWHSRVWLDYAPTRSGRVPTKVVAVQMIHTYESQIVSVQAEYANQIARELSNIAYKLR